MADTEVEKAIQAVYDEAGEVTADRVLAAARDEDSPLHAHFEWDDSIAGEAHRREQARRLIRSVKIVYREATPQERARRTRAWHSVRQEGGQRAYRPAETVARDPMMRQMLLADMRREWETLKRKYGEFEEFAAMVAEDFKIN